MGENSSKIKAENGPLELATTRGSFLTVGPVSIEWGRQNTYGSGRQAVWKLLSPDFLLFLESVQTSSVRPCILIFGLKVWLPYFCAAYESTELNDLWRGRGE